MQTIQWFPGHMAKAKREILEKIKMVDLIIELKDARIPYSSTNPMIDEIVGNKPRLILLNKSSIADPKVTKSWMDYYQSKNILSLDIDSITNYHISSVVKYCKLALLIVLVLVVFPQSLCEFFLILKDALPQDLIKYRLCFLVLKVLLVFRLEHDQYQLLSKFHGFLLNTKLGLVLLQLPHFPMQGNNMDYL